jgi:hypothetical protein
MSFSGVRNALIWMVFVSLSAACGSAPAPSSPAAVEGEAREFMAGYEAEMQGSNGEALAARYHRAGAYWMLQGRKRFLEHDSIVRYFRETWSAPAEFRWTDLSYEVLGNDAVVVIGTMQFTEPDHRTAIGSYTALLLRQDGELRIRVEDEAFDNYPAAACPPGSGACGIPIHARLAARYVGGYDQGTFQWRLLEQGGSYFIELPGQPPARLLYYGDHEFRLAEDPGVRVLFDGAGDRAQSYVAFRGQLFGAGRRVE